MTDLTWDSESDWDAATTEDIAIDGDVFRLASIPESAIHHWRFDEGSGSTAADSIGNADGTITGPTWTSGTWVGDWALDGDGTDDYIETTTWGDFGSQRSSDFATAFTIESVADEGYVIARGSDLRIYLGVFDADPGEPGILMRDDDGNRIEIAADTTVNDGTSHRLMINKTGNAGNDIRFYIDATEVSTTTHTDEGFGDPVSDFSDPVYFFDYNTSSTIPLDGIVDDILVFDNSLTEQEIQDDYQRQPWS